MTNRELKELRVKLGLTQTEMGLKLGITRGQIAKLEAGDSSITPMLELLLKHLPS